MIWYGRVNRDVFGFYNIQGVMDLKVTIQIERRIGAYEVINNRETLTRDRRKIILTNRPFKVHNSSAHMVSMNSLPNWLDTLSTGILLGTSPTFGVSSRVPHCALKSPQIKNSLSW